MTARDGTLQGAWEYFQQSGLVDGGDYGTQSACYAYPFAPCAHHTSPDGTPSTPCTEDSTPPAKTTCNNGAGWSASKWFGQAGQQLPSDVQSIMREIYYHGPVQVGFNVYQDFLSYSKGVYQHTTGSFLGGHAVKLVGWGTTSTGQAYWICVNNWNSDWGVDGGFAIARGTDECGIEDMVWAGEPRLS